MVLVPGKKFVEQRHIWDFQKQPSEVFIKKVFFNVDLRFSATISFCQILEHFLWFWEAGAKFIRLYIKFEVKLSIILAP